MSAFLLTPGAFLGLSLLIGLGLLAFHWRWLRRRAFEPAGSVAA